MRIEDHSWRGLQPDLVNWLNDVTELLNSGGYQISSSSVPASTTGENTGGHRIAKDGSTWYLYIYTGTDDGWKKVALSALS